MENFGGSQKEYILAATGGIILCIATSIHLLFKGRVTGLAVLFIISFCSINFAKGIFFFSNQAGLIALLAVNILFWNYSSSFMVEVFEIRKNLLPKQFQISFFDPPINKFSSTHFYEMIIGAYLIGFGTKLCNGFQLFYYYYLLGCTSGHGICGLPRLSIRSIVAVLAFMFTGVLIATLKYNLGFSPIIDDLSSSIPSDQFIFFGISLPYLTGIFSICLTIFIILINQKDHGKIVDIIVTFIVGFLMCIGINLAGMGKSSKVINFLTLRQQWDPSLMFIMGGAVLGNFITFYLIIHVIKKPIFSNSFAIPTNTVIDWKLLGGSLIFGLGWGICGVCPGSAMTIFSLLYKEHILFYVIPMAIGQYSAFYLVKYEEKLKSVVVEKKVK